MTKEEKSLWEKYNFDAAIQINFAQQTEPAKDLNAREIKEELEREGNLSSKWELRSLLLRALDVKRTEHADNIIIIGCFPYVTTPYEVQTYFQLLNLLGIDYDVLDKEYCCGGLLILRAKSGEREEAELLQKDIVKKNIDQAREAGASRVFYYCHGCIAEAQRYFKEGDISVEYMLDIFTEPLKKVKRLKAKPAKVGYFRGCWRLKTDLTPGFELPFDTYRSWLDCIEGIEVVDIPHNICCYHNPKAILRKIADMNVDYTVTICNSCRSLLGRQGAEVESMHSLLLEALTYQG